MDEQLPKDFDPDLYLRLYPGVRQSGMDPAHHWLNYGCKENRRYRPETPLFGDTVNDNTLPDDIQTLDAFAQWFLDRAPRFGVIPTYGAVTYIEDVTAILWFRARQFQVQMFVVPPNYTIPAHTHPNVDSYELYLGGDIAFTINGAFAESAAEAQAVGDFGEASQRGSLIRVRPDDPHGGRFGPNGGVFMSLQHWLNGVAPHCVAADYTGRVMGPHHFDAVKDGEPELAAQSELTEDDALNI